MLRAVDDHPAGLTGARRVVVEAEALAAATDEARQNLDSPVMARFRKALVLKTVREHVAETLRNRKPGPTPFRGPARGGGLAPPPSVRGFRRRD